MSTAVAMMSNLLQLAVGDRVEHEGPAQRTQFTLAALLSALGFAALWGLAAGSSSLGLALGNAYKLPMIVLLSGLSAMPAGLLALRLSARGYSARELLLSFATSVYAGTLVLAVLSPLVALYYHTSAWAGPYLGMGSAIAALVVATVTFARGTIRRAPPELSHRGLLAIPLVVTVFIQLAALLQFVAMASPILPETTVFDSGIDRVVSR
ncbi:MAG: hypothetical protein K1X88_28365 [Nannocystaceae bacterium]|nr:hypothetical protein [Nannocystaceae bacterium]